MITESNRRGEAIAYSTRLDFFFLFIGSFRSTAVASEEEMLALRPPSIRLDPYVPEFTTGHKMEISPQTAARPNCADDCDPVSDKPPLSYPWNVFLHLATSHRLVTVENDQKADSEKASQPVGQRRPFLLPIDRQRFSKSFLVQSGQNYVLIDEQKK